MFNPWWEVDSENDVSEAPRIRRSQLSHYLSERQHRARYVFMAEALGYQGGHFTGIAMTSERLLLGGLKKKQIEPGHVFRGLQAQRTSRDSVKKDGFSEPTCTVVWGQLLRLGLDSHDFVLWNAFPWHPYKPEQGVLSNRTPSEAELCAAEKITGSFLSLFPEAMLIAIGEKSSGSLRHMGYDVLKVRHPANGGVPRFCQEVKHILQQA